MKLFANGLAKAQRAATHPKAHSFSALTKSARIRQVYTKRKKSQQKAYNSNPYKIDMIGAKSLVELRSEI
jgi:hypothetical protein